MKIYWYPPPRRDGALGAYYFQYYDEGSSSWVSPAAWQAGSGHQEKGQWQTFTLPASVSTKQLRLFWPTNGTGGGPVFVAEWQAISTMAADVVMNASSGNLTVGGNLDFTDITLNPGTGTVVMNSTATGKTIKSDAQSFHNLTFNGVGGGWTAQDDLIVGGDLKATKGTIDITSKNLSVTGDLTVDGGTLDASDAACN